MILLIGRAFVFCKTIVARPLWVVRAADPTVGRSQRLCLDVQLICEKLKVIFVKSLGVYGWVASKFEIFF
jgi:hypothetical protein